MAKTTRTKAGQPAGLSLYLEEAKRLLRQEFPETAQAILERLERRWSFLRTRQIFDSCVADYKLRSLEASEICAARKLMTEIFPQGKVNLVPKEQDGLLSVSVELPEGNLEGDFKVDPDEADDKPQKVQYLPFPACLAADPGLVWLMGRSSTLSESEARIALNALEGDFWASKKGLALLKAHVPRTWAEFLERVPTTQLKAKGLKRHYPDPGVLRALDGNGTIEPRTTDPETKAASSAGSHPPAVYNEA
jgi:hypothetical protein